MLREVKGKNEWKAILRVWWGKDFTGVSYEHTWDVGLALPVVTPAQDDLGVWSVEMVWGFNCVCFLFVCFCFFTFGRSSILAVLFIYFIAIHCPNLVHILLGASSSADILLLVC